jgi:hypothetical protein
VKRLLKFNVFEKLNPEWFEQNPDFYLSKSRKDIDKGKEQREETKLSKKNFETFMKKLKINNIKWEVEDDNKNGILSYRIINIKELDGILIRYYTSDKWHRKGEYQYINEGYSNSYIYKVLLSFIRYKNGNDFLINGIPSNIISDFFKENNNYYGLYYSDGSHHELFLSKDKDKYLSKIKDVKENREGYKILYYNNKVKGKELINYKDLNITKIRNKLKNIKYTDIGFIIDKRFDEWEDRPLKYRVVLNDKELDKQLEESELLRSFNFSKESKHMMADKTYFGHLKNRYHTGYLGHEIQGIGFGYKCYKAFVKFNGYIVSDTSTSVSARNTYRKLLKDDDIYHVINDKEDKIMLIWKDYKNIEKLMRIVKKEEERSNKKFIYDDELLKYLK